MSEPLDPTPLPATSSLLAQPSLPKPLLRGRLHELAFWISVPAGIALVALANGVAAHVGAAIFAVSLSAVYGVSAAYHRGRWSERARATMQRLDHAMIFVLIAGTYTPVCLLVLHVPWAVTVLALAWVGALTGIALVVARRAPRLAFALYLILGWLAIIVAPQLLDSLSVTELALLLTGGILYSAGAVMLATNWPDPSPRVFGYHEVWHAMGVTAGVCHYTLIMLLVRA
jgi:hemolysin III